MSPCPARPPIARPGARRPSCTVLAALLTVGCAQGSLDGADAGSVDALTGGAGWRKPPVGSGDPGDAPSVGGEPQPQAPPSAKPPAGACGSIDAGGVCKGSVAFYCQDGALETQDCRALGSACVFVAAQGGFRCDPAAPPPDDDGDGLPDAPPPDDDSPLPPDDDSPLPPDEPPLPPDRDDPAPPDADPDPPPAGGGCGAIDYLGECRGDVAVWCNGDALAEADCRALGTTCEWIDDQIGYYCRDPEPVAGADAFVSPPPEPDAFVPPPPEPGCDLGFQGECRGDVARFCVGDALIEVDCTLDGQTCDFVNDAVGYYCIGAAAPVDECGGVDYTGYCDGDIVVWCDGGRLYSVDCAATGEICAWISEDGGYFCLGGP
jgi:hypothetical protein